MRADASHFGLVEVARRRRLGLDGDVNRLALSALLVLAACGSSSEAPPAPVLLTHADYDCRAETPEPRPEVEPGCLLDPDCDRSLVVGHRGAGGNFGVYAPENSLSAIRFAILIGADAVEIDVRHSRDDRLVLMHDGSLERTTGVEANTDTLSLDELVALPLLDPGFLGAFDCETVPTFEAALAIAKGRVDVVVDTKTSRGDLVARAIVEAQMLDQAVISVSSVDTAVAAREAVPEIRIQLRPDSIEEYEAMKPRFSRPPEILEIPADALSDFAPIREEEHNRLFVDVFGLDAQVFGDGDVRAYDPVYADGADVLQSEFPAWVLMSLDRDYWEKLPAPRDLGLDSPLLRD